MKDLIIIRESLDYSIRHVSGQEHHPDTLTGLRETRDRVRGEIAKRKEVSKKRRAQ